MQRRGGYLLSCVCFFSSQRHTWVVAGKVGKNEWEKLRLISFQSVVSLIRNEKGLLSVFFRKLECTKFS
jgi:hypothetical protein